MYIIQEVQTTGGQTILGTPMTRPDRQAAESVFYSLCAYAVISTVEEHAIVTYTHEGFPIPELTKCFRHEPVPVTPAVEPVEEYEEPEDTEEPEVNDDTEGTEEEPEEPEEEPEEVTEG